MAGFSTDKDRKVIPRWRTLGETLRRRELDSVAPPRVQQEIASDDMARKLMDWQQHQTIGHASDLVGTAVALRREDDVEAAAKFLIREDLHVSPWAKELAEHVLKSSDGNGVKAPSPAVLEPSTLYAKVRNLKQLLHFEPRDPIKWVELSRVYAILGHGGQAGRCMSIALQLATDNRFTLRSACRLYVHLDDPERAHEILLKADRTRHDPWLLAAEIAVGSIAQRRPRFVKPARRMLAAGRFEQAHTSELASALATLELESGSIRRAKRLFKLSLADPTENSIAQAAWVTRQEKGIHFDDQYLTLPNAFEANSWVSFKNGHWDRAVEQCELWQLDQPFSSRPSTFGSFIAAIVLEDYETSEWFAESGLRANPMDFMLLNNLAFARINRGDLDGAEEALTRAVNSQMSVRDNVVMQATKGLMAFQTGNIEGGRQLYSEALAEAGKLGNQDLLLIALASVFLAKEVISWKGTENSPEVGAAFQALKRGRDPIFRVLEDRLAKLTTGSK